MFDNVIKIHLKQRKFLLLIKSKINVYFLKREGLNTFDENIFPWFLKKKNYDFYPTGCNFLFP